MDVDGPSPVERSPEELDHIECSTKKQKGDSSAFTPQRPLRSYKDSLVYPEGMSEERNTSLLPG